MKLTSGLALILTLFFSTGSYALRTIDINKISDAMEHYQAGDVEGFKSAVKRHGIQPGDVAKTGRSAFKRIGLIHAVAANTTQPDERHKEMFDWLMKKGFDPNLQSPDTGHPPLVYTSGKPFTDVAKWLVSAGAPMFFAYHEKDLDGDDLPFVTTTFAQIIAWDFKENKVTRWFLEMGYDVLERGSCNALIRRRANGSDNNRDYDEQDEILNEYGADDMSKCDRGSDDLPIN